MIIEKEKVWTLPNILSTLRLVLGIIVYFLIAAQHVWLAVILIMIAISTDYADGYFARKNQQISELGKILDPVADKIAVGLGSLALYQSFGLPIWILLLIVGRDVLILIGAVLLLGKIRKVTASDMPGKMTVAVIALLLVSYLFRVASIQTPLLAVTVVFLAVSFGFYLLKFIRLYR